MSCITTFAHYRSTSLPLIFFIHDYSTALEVDSSFAAKKTLQQKYKIKIVMLLCPARQLIKKTETHKSGKVTQSFSENNIIT